MKKNSQKTPATSNRRPNIKLLAIILATMLALGFGGIFAFSSIGKNNEPETTTEEPNDKVNYDPPTEAEQSAGDKQKEEIIRNQPADSSNEGHSSGNNSPSSNSEASSSKKKVTPSITSWEKTNGNIVFRGIAPVTESSGTCTIVMEKRGQRVTAKSQASRDSQHMNCIVNVQASKIPGSGWVAKLIYSSDRYMGESEVEPFSL